MLMNRLREMKFVIVAVVWMLGTLALEIEPEDTCENEEYPGISLVIHANKDGLRRCCVNVKCSPGTEARLCEHLKPDSTSCISCKPGTFQNYTTESFYMIKCQLHTRCHQDAVVYHPGSNTTDVKCICNLELGYYGTWPDCHSGKRCELGQQLRHSGTCEQCPPNFYKITSSSRPCSSCSRCDFVTQEIANNCTAVSDTICRNKTFDHNPDDVNNLATRDFRILITSVVLGAVVVIGVSFIFIVILCSKKCRTGGNTHSRASFSSGSTSDNSIGPGVAIYQRDEDESKGTVLEENLYQQCPENTVGTQREAGHLQRSSLCDFDAVRNMPNSDFDNHRSTESEGLLNSPVEDMSVMVESFDLMDERQNSTGREDSPAAVKYEVETAVSAVQRTGSIPFQSPGATVMKGKCNVKQGNVYNFKNCRDVRIVHKI